MKRIRIAFIASTLGVGGAESVMLDLVTRLPKERFESLFLFLQKPGITGQRMLEAGLKVESGFEQRRHDPTVLVRLLPRLKKFAPDIVFLLDHHNAIFWGGLGAKFAGVRHRVVASHSTGRMNGRKNFRPLDRVVLRGISRVIALSKSHVAYLKTAEGVRTDQIEVIENGIDTGRYSAVDKSSSARVRAEFGLGVSDRVVMMVAALRPEKAHEALVHAAKRLIASHTNLKFLIVGEGVQRAVIEKLIADLALGEHVVMTGVRHDIPAMLSVADVLVLPSHPAVETLPIAVLEAMAAGVPVIASRVGSVPDLIEDGVNGRLIAPADADGLAEAVDDIINNESKTAKLVENARKTVSDRYTVERMVARYAALFESLTN